MSIFQIIINHQQNHIKITMELREVAAVSGRGGLFKILKHYSFTGRRRINHLRCRNDWCRTWLFMVQQLSRAGVSG